METTVLFIRYGFEWKCGTPEYSSDRSRMGTWIESMNDADHRCDYGNLESTFMNMLALFERTNSCRMVLCVCK